MVKLKKIKEFLNFLDNKTKILLFVFTCLLFLSIFQVIAGFLSFGLVYSLEGILLFSISIYVIFFILRLSQGIYSSVRVIKKLSDDYYPFSSLEEIPNFILKNFIIMVRKVKTLTYFKNVLLTAIREIDDLGIILVDKDKNIITYSKFVEKVFNISENYLGKKIYSLFSLLSHKIDFLKDGEPLEFEVPFDGSNRILRLYLKSFESIAIIYFFDITELRKIEELNELSLSIFSHELNTPLTNLSLSIENILMSKEYSEEILNIAISNIMRISNTISNIISLSNIHSNRALVTNRVFNLKFMIDRVVNILYPVYKSKNISVSIDYKGSEEVFCDEGKVELMLFNLIDNAMKFSPEYGCVNICVNNGDILDMSISNQVVNFFSYDLGRIFDKFYRGRNSVGYRGSGLGLYIVSLLADLLRFKVEVSLEGNVIIFRIVGG